MSEFKHGGSGYSNYGCRCEVCTTANAVSARKGRAKRRLEPKDPADSRHGTRVFYVQHGCRCERCTAAHTGFVEARRVERYAEAKSPDDPRHGTVSFYRNHGCRCEPCKAAGRADNKRLYDKRMAAKK